MADVPRLGPDVPRLNPDVPRLGQHHPDIGYFAHSVPERRAAVVAKGFGRIVLVPVDVGGAGAERCWWASPGLLDRSNPYIGYLAHARDTSGAQDIFTPALPARPPDPL